MSRCARCCLHRSMRAVNLLTNLLGIGMIVYSLWLQKKWFEGVAELPSASSLPKPWIIYTCLGVGIAVCLSTVYGHMVANCISNSVLCMYTITICSLLVLEVSVIVTIFFKMDWEMQVSEYIDEHHKTFKSFVIFHIKMCHLILILILIPQINVIVLAIILWAVGTEPPTHCRELDIPDFTQSFLVPNSATLDVSRQTWRSCNNLQEEILP